MLYKVKVNNNIELDISDEILSNTDAVQTSEKTYHILQDNTSYLAEIKSSNFNKKLYTININSNIYEVAILNPLDILIKDMGLSFGKTKHVNSVKAPMPGLILDINVKNGQKVKEDETLLILGAMKMENIILSPRDGIIKSIAVNKGDAIEKGQLLIEFE